MTLLVLVALVAGLGLPARWLIGLAASQSAAPKARGRPHHKN